MSTKDGAPLYVKLAGLVTIIIICFFSINSQKKKGRDLENRGRYTIGITKGVNINHRSSKYGLRYSFWTAGSSYDGYMKLESISGIKTDGGEYIVVFDPKSPKNNKLLTEKKVIFHPAVISDTGWLVVPEYILKYKKDSSGSN